MRLETQDAAASSRLESSVLHDFAIWRRMLLKTVTELGAARVSERNVLTGEGRVEALRVAVTASAFPLTRVSPLLGRALQPADEVQGAEPVVVLGYDVWQTQFLRDPAMVGRVVTVGRTPRTVVEVMPPRLGFPRNQQAWVLAARTRRRTSPPCSCSAVSRTMRAGKTLRRSSTSSRRP